MSRVKSAIIWSDPHHPHMDGVAHSAIYQFSRERPPDYHVHIGDILDLCGISRWSTMNFLTQNEERVIDGLLSAGQHFNTLFEINPKAKVVWILGNHDLRLEAFIESHPSWRGICDDILGLLKFFGKCKKANKIEIVRLDDWEDDYNIGKMHFAHGFSTCKHVAAKHVEEYDEAVTVGHSHTMQMFTTTKRGEPRAGYVIGHLSNRGARKYLKGRPTRWVTGFAYMEYDDTGEFTQHLLPIVNGKFRFAGRVYDGKKEG